MERRTVLRLGHLAGIPIGIQPLWLLVVGLLTYALGHDYFPTEDPGLSSTAAYVLGLLSALTLFAGIVAHELGHAVVARRHELEVEEIDLWLLGGVARMKGEPRRPEDELRFALAGPAVTAVILLFAGLLRVALGGVLPDWGNALLDYQIWVNATILGFNLLPAFPLDGGRVARALLWRRSGDQQLATDRAAAVGRAFGWGFVVLGLLSFSGGVVSGMWLALVGGFLIVASGAEAQQLHLRQAFSETSAADLMSSPVVTLPASATIDDAIAEGFTAHLYEAFPVVDDDDRTVGVLSLKDVRAVPLQRRRVLTTADVAKRDPDLVVDPWTPIIDLLQRPVFLTVGRAVVADRDGHPLGLVSVTDVQRRLRADALRTDPRRAQAVGAP
jgi:Zn-dependent protease/predicted transcriptional regulator